MGHGFIDSLRKSASEWKAIPENLRSGEKRKRIPAIFGVVGSAVLACVGIELGVGIAADIDESIKKPKRQQSKRGLIDQVAPLKLLINSRHQSMKSLFQQVKHIQQ